MQRRPRSRSSGRRRRWTAATRSCGERMTTGSSGTGRTPRPERVLRSGSPEARCPPPRTTGESPNRSVAAMDGLIAVVVFAGVVVVVAVVGVRLGMLAAPRLDRLTDPHDEADGDQHD